MSRWKSQIDVLASLVHPRTGHKWRNRFVMIEAYFDESGIHEGAAVCIVGGYYANQALWRRFEKQWNKVIGDYPELVRTGFHAKVFFARGKRVGPYKSWSDDKADKFLERLVQCIMRNGISPIGYGVVVADFLALPLLDRKWFTGAKFTPKGKALTPGCPNKPYYLPFQYCVLHSARLSGTAKVEKLHFFAGLDRTFSGYANELFKHLPNDARLPASLIGMLGSISYPQAKDTPGVQAADLLANRMYQHAIKVAKNGPQLPTPPLLDNLMKNKREGQRFLLFEKRALHEIQESGRRQYDKLIQKGEGALDAYLKELKNK